MMLISIQSFNSHFFLSLSCNCSLSIFTCMCKFLGSLLFLVQHMQCRCPQCTGIHTTNCSISFFWDKPDILSCKHIDISLFPIVDLRYMVLQMALSGSCMCRPFHSTDALHSGTCALPLLCTCPCNLCDLEEYVLGILCALRYRSSCSALWLQHTHSSQVIFVNIVPDICSIRQSTVCICGLVSRFQLVFYIACILLLLLFDQLQEIFVNLVYYFGKKNNWKKNKKNNFTRIKYFTQKRRFV